MPCPHFSISIVKGSKGKSAVAAAAYDSGQKLYSERDMKYKDYSRRKDVMYEEVMLPANAPPEYKDREVLWNSVEVNEKRFDAQYARRIVAALPRELPKRDLIPLMRTFCYQNFVLKGMCCDFAIHDDCSGNPHAHILLTMRGIDENGNWMPKSRMVYEYDERGEKIKLPSGNYKSHKENTVDWNDKKYAEIWRHEWEVINNRYIEFYGRDVRLDMRSYKRQGVDKIPMVHMGNAAFALEKKGELTGLKALNEDIKKVNTEKKGIREEIAGIFKALSDLHNELKEAEKEEKLNSLTNVLLDYMDIRRNERMDWTTGGKNKGTARDLGEVSALVSFLEAKGVGRIDKFCEYASGLLSRNDEIQRKLKKNDKRIREIKRILDSLEIVKEYKPIHDKYVGIFWKKKKEEYAFTYDEELEAYDKADKYLLAKYPDRSIPTGKLKSELERLTEENSSLNAELKEVAGDVEKTKKIRQILKRMRPELFGQSEVEQEEPVKTEPAQPVKEAEAKSPDERPSLLGRMREKKEYVDAKDRERKERGEVRSVRSRDGHSL